jgi:Flp pilus assembly protein TadD
LNSNWQKRVLASSGYLELGMLDDASSALDEIALPDQTRVEVLGARLALHIAARKWRLAADLAGHLVKIKPENASWWIQMAYAIRRCETLERAEAILLQARKIHPTDVIILLNLASYASVTGRTEQAKVRLREAMKLDSGIRRLALNVEDLRPLWEWICTLE